MPDSPIEIAIADSSPLMLSALSAYVDQCSEFALVATANTADGFLAAVERNRVAIGLISWDLPAMGGERLLQTLRSQPNSPRIIVGGAPADADIVYRAIAAGAAGFSSRYQSPVHLLAAAHAAAQGHMIFPFVDMRELTQSAPMRLTARERCLLAALARGLSNKVLAQEFEISVNTVKFHLSNLYDKLGVASRAEAIALYHSSTLLRHVGS